MIDPSQIKANYSARVALVLVAGGVSYPLAKIGPNHVVLRSPAEIPSCVGEIRVTVGANERVWPVKVSGSVPFDDSVAIADCAS